MHHGSVDVPTPVDQRVELGMEGDETGKKNGTNVIEPGGDVDALGEMDRNIEVRQAEIAAVVSGIEEVRDRLGLPVLTSTEEPKSTEIERRKIDELRKHREDLIREKLSDEQQREDMEKFERGLRSVLQEFGTNSKTMLDALYERQQQRLTPLQNGDNFHLMTALIRDISGFDEKINPESVLKLIGKIDTLGRAFGDMRPKPSGQIKESEQNLEKLAFGAKRFSATCSESKGRLPLEMKDKEMEAQSIKMRTSLQILSEQVSKLHIFAVRSREQIR
jgi:hypothetical protein